MLPIWIQTNYFSTTGNVMQSLQIVLFQLNQPKILIPSCVQGVITFDGYD